MKRKMGKYGIFTTLGNLINGDDIINSSEIVKTLTACSTVFYLSCKNGKTIFGTTLDVQKFQTREHTVVFLQETNWINGKPRAVRSEKITDFFKEVVLKLHELEYSIERISSDTFNSYLTELELENKTVMPLPDSPPPQIVKYTIGRLLYGKTVLCTSVHPQIAISYLSTLTQDYESFLKYGYTFAITKFAIKESDVNILIDSKALHVNFNIDSGNIYDGSDKISNYLDYSKLVAEKRVKFSFPPSSNKASLPSGMIKYIMEKKIVLNKSERDKYAQFLNSESVSYDPQLLNIAAFTDTNKSPKSKKTSKTPHLNDIKKSPPHTGKKAENVAENENKHCIFRLLLFKFLRNKTVSVEGPLEDCAGADLGSVSGDVDYSIAKNDKPFLSEEKSDVNKSEKGKRPSITSAKNAKLKSKKEKQKFKEKKKNSAGKKKRGRKIFFFLTLVILLLIAVAAVLVVLIANGYIPELSGPPDVVHGWIAQFFSSVSPLVNNGSTK